MLNIGEGFSYATVWQPDVQEKRVVCNLTTSRKLKEPVDGKEYENSNWNKAVFVGHAFNQAKDLNEKDRIKILSGTVDNRPYTGADGVKRYFNNVVIFEFERMCSPDEVANAASSSKSKGTQYAMVEEDEDVPY